MLEGSASGGLGQLQWSSSTSVHLCDQIADWEAWYNI